MSTRYIDAHLHLQDERLFGKAAQIIARAESRGVHRFFCNATRESDWQLVIELARKFSGIVPFFGTHPWQVETVMVGWEKRLADALSSCASAGAGIGEIGLNKNTVSELKIFEEHVDIAKKYDTPILIHTPHLEDKLKGTRLIIDALKNANVDPGKVIIDHVEEHTTGLVIDAGFWAGMTLYPESKCSLPRAVDILETFGQENIWMNSACDWGISDPLAVAKCTIEMKRRQYSEKDITKVVYDNPVKFLSQSKNFSI